ncbi:hypothetical protein GCM10027275_43100 [Rhabdobacter roseus]|uniref:histidine kinase n=1 Tax=Rhabdobacter roseus TaxID=1655419 RepID=A0A840TUQ5_9BACT|nr:HAMP domain-containing sensor histidine kinase [Rhabdobacter roseus]MBB5286635.1 signal transduction histidine kinase [Rhabdobacter roseus]
MDPLKISFTADIIPDFSIAYAHEIRNPLANINLSVEMIELEHKTGDVQPYLDIIKRNSLRIKDLVNELLAYHYKQEKPKEKHSIHQLLDEVLELAEDRIQLKKIKVFKGYEGDDIFLNMDAPKIKIALTNIVTNAIEAMVAGNGKLKVLVRSVDGRCQLRIEDNGCGISEANLKNISKIYFTNKPDGLGIGLATTYTILRSNNVGIKVESQEGVGTQFILSFELPSPDTVFS